MTHVSSSAPILLGAASATPPSRTPWGGHRIAARKAAPGGGSGAEPGGIVGESWEISLDPDFPSRTLDGVPLADVLRADPAHYLGREARVGRTGTALLLKWLDAAERLSLQIHPRDGDPALAPLESGKPEAWYVVERTPGAGLYIGYRVGVGESEIRHAIDAGNSLEPLLQFVAVEPGDFFVIEAGTPHAIGEGVFVVEPQHVVPGRHGVTYRYWDWGRRYDKAGRASADGAPRELHLEAALRVTDWSCAGADWLAGVRFRAGRAALGGAMCVEPLGGPGAPVSSDHLAV
ncbi:MAG: class I mannose-6-phosphate isomerase, partial [Myxococcales bacterium]|nr:class I mannose-6-phosphate isomerase [Myxococcales bacterium]